MSETPQILSLQDKTNPKQQLQQLKPTNPVSPLIVDAQGTTKIFSTTDQVVNEQQAGSASKEQNKKNQSLEIPPQVRVIFDNLNQKYLEYYTDPLLKTLDSSAKYKENPTGGYKGIEITTPKGVPLACGETSVFAANEILQITEIQDWLGRTNQRIVIATGNSPTFFNGETSVSMHTFLLITSNNEENVDAIRGSTQVWDPSFGYLAPLQDSGYTIQSLFTSKQLPPIEELNMDIPESSVLHNTEYSLLDKKEFDKAELVVYGLTPNKRFAVCLGSYQNNIFDMQEKPKPFVFLSDSADTVRGVFTLESDVIGNNTDLIDSSSKAIAQQILLHIDKMVKEPSPDDSSFEGSTSFNPQVLVAPKNIDALESAFIGVGKY